MKKIIILLIFSLYLIPNLQNNLMAQSDCYDDSGCDDWVYNGGPIPFRIPQFPDCDIYVWYHTRQCGDEVQIWISLIDAELEEDENCHGLRDFIYPNGYQGPINDGAVATLWEELYKQVSLKLFNDQTQGWTDAQKEQFLCSNEDYLTNHTYFHDICRKFCIRNESSQDQIKMFIIEKRCTMQYCCQVELKYCFNKIWNIDESKWDYIPSIYFSKSAEEVIDCNQVFTNSEYCPPSYPWQTDCHPSCE